MACMRQGLAEVFRMKNILDNSGINGGDGSDALIVCESLTRLRDMELSVKTLEETGIGKSVKVLQKHASKEVRQTASALMKAWKAMANAWFDTTQKKLVISLSESVPQASVESGKSNMGKQQQKPRIMIRLKSGTERTSGHVSYTASTPVVPSQRRKAVDSEDEDEKFKAAARRMREGYEKLENAKRQRTTRFIEFHEIMQQGLVPPSRSVNRNRK